MSTPITWEELVGVVLPGTFHLRNLPVRLQRLAKDPWEEYFELHQKLPG